MQKILLILFFSLIANAFAKNMETNIPMEYHFIYPDKVRQCLNNPKASGLTVFNANNPYYIRGDFDSDSKPDYALEVRSPKGLMGILVCTGNGLVTLLGAGIGGERMSDHPNDNFLGFQWQVCTKEEVIELGKWIGNSVPNPIPFTKGEAIAIIYDHEIGLIYWDGHKFKWTVGK
jgi:hypothetical protein